MLVRKVMIQEYGEDGWGGHVRWLVNPVWEQIEQAIRRLDRFRHPFLWFYFDEPAQQDDMPEFEIVGGNGAYVIYADDDETGKRRHFIDPAKGSSPVNVWTSDQGTSAPERDVCSDLDSVLTITRHFCETGKLHPAVQWE